jgi:phosphosulfolactate phosphohydrolase-like enzyme
VCGAVVTLDVIRAFTTAAYAFAAGAREIFLCGTVDTFQFAMEVVSTDRGMRLTAVAA